MATKTPDRSWEERDKSLRKPEVLSEEDASRFLQGCQLPEDPQGHSFTRMSMFHLSSALASASVKLISLVFLLLSFTAACSMRSAPSTQTGTQAPEITPAITIKAFQEARLAMVRDTIAARGVEDPDVLAAMETVPRHEFIPIEYQEQAYGDHPLPIGFGQTISQPYVVALMTQLLELQPGEKVLEIGTGSGYQAAVLAELGDLEVYSIEIIPELAERAAANLEKAGYREVHLRQGDGYFGWEAQAPFEAIIVTAAPDHLPLPLVQQLAEGGRLVIPIGPPGSYQTLWQFVNVEGELKASNLGGVSFVSLVGGEEE